MTFAKRMASAEALGAAMLIGVGLSALPAQAGYIVTLMQQGPDVVATGSGTINLTDLTFFASLTPTPPGIAPSSGIIITGLENLADIYTGFAGPTSFGSGGLTNATSGSGDFVGIDDLDSSLFVPLGYVSGSALSDIATYDNQTFSTLGVIPGTYVWTWGSGATADSFTLQIGGVSVPESSGILLLALPLSLVMLLAARQHRAERTEPVGPA